MGKGDTKMTDRQWADRALALVRKGLRELLITIIPALLVALFINVYVAEAASVKDGPSMQPNLYVGYRVLMEKVSYRFGPLQRGDVVVVDRPGEAVSLIKRVIGLPGEIIEVQGGRVLVDGERLEEPWVAYLGGPNCPAQRVPEGHVFVIGDNRANSLDSRVLGPMPIERVEGHVFLIYWPWDEAKLMP
jgi:signal peptidase I